MSKREELLERKRRAMELMDAGLPWREANEQSKLNYSKSGIQQLYRQWQAGGEEALVDQRSGSQARKATSAVRAWIVKRCEAEGEVRASRLTTELKAKFEVELHPDYVGLLRRQLGLPVPRPGRPSKKQDIEPAPVTETAADFSP
jgi:transposase